jgi:hypothetical protein
MLYYWGLVPTLAGIFIFPPDEQIGSIANHPLAERVPGTLLHIILWPRPSGAVLSLPVFYFMVYSLYRGWLYCAFSVLHTHVVPW